MTYQVRFVGGPLGGEIRAWASRPPMMIQVPAIRDFREMYALVDMGVSCPMTMDLEQYEVRRTTTEWAMEAFWVNPNARLRKEISRLEGVNSRLQFLNENLTEEVKAALPYKHLADAVKEILADG